MEAKDAIRIADAMLEDCKGRIADAMLEDCKGARVMVRYERSPEQIENDKLRELVRDMFATFCVVRDAPMTNREELKHSVRFWKRLDELGIEVELCE